MYEVKDKQTDKVLGHFYLDLYPRPDKFNHAACFTLLKRENNAGKVYPAAAAMVSNFVPGKEGETVTLSHGEVVTFFHEFGHVMHNICNEANFARFAGASVEKDFVEMPSQMLENWMWDKKVMKRMSKHVKTGEQMPDELIDKKIKSKNLHVASETLNQITMATVDLLLNSANDKKLLSKVPHRPALAQFFTGDDSISRIRADLKFADGNIDTGALWRKLAFKIESTRYQEGANPLGSFGHLIAGYVSSYYSYLWSQVYADDLFSQFQKEGVLNPKIGMRYRRTILAPGGSVDSIDSLKSFLGREPNQDAFIKNNSFDGESSKASDEVVSEKTAKKDKKKLNNDK